MSSIWSTPLNSLTYEDVRCFCGKRLRENLTLEYKERFSDGGEKVAREVAAFANTLGGTIIYGVVDKNGKPAKDSNGVDLKESDHDAIVSACHCHISPPVQVEVSGLLSNPDDPSESFMVVRVPASPELHLVEGKAGIYVRQEDHSEASRATIDVISALMGKRKDVISQQEKRRDDAAERLRMPVTHEIVVPSGSKSCFLSLMFGPRLAFSPLCRNDELRDRREEYCAQLTWRDARLGSGTSCAPFMAGMPVLGMVDGIYGVNRNSQSSGSVDRYGNLVTFCHVLSPINNHDAQLGRLNDHRGHALDENGNLVGVHAIKIGLQILVAFQAMQKMITTFPYVGELQLKVVVEGTRHLPLVGTRAPSGMHPIIASSFNDDWVSASISVPSDALRSYEQFEPYFREIFTNILWSWGCTNSQELDDAFYANEFACFGRDTCRCKNHSKPRNREKCYFCEKAEHEGKS
ncbi:MAG: helix-turn-helix domain-containing protein [Phycisphaerae bacterium]